MEVTGQMVIWSLCPTPWRVGRQVGPGTDGSSTGDRHQGTSWSRIPWAHQGPLQVPDSWMRAPLSSAAGNSPLCSPNLPLLLMGRVLTSPRGVQALAINLASLSGCSSISVPLLWSVPSGLFGGGVSCHPKGQEDQIDKGVMDCRSHLQGRACQVWFPRP